MLPARPLLTLTLLLLLAQPAAGQATIKLGIDVLAERNFDLLAGKRVGLVANPASVDSRLRCTIDILRGAPQVNLVALYGPEHGVWGDEYAGDRIDNRIDPKTGLPIFSLYGATRKPTPEMLAGIDVLVFDLQDIGSRSYTYISTMEACLEACAEQGKEFVVLDRPNPLGGVRVEGPGLEAKFESFISALQVPYIHGMTMGELARMTRDKHFPRFEKLSIVPMLNWKRDMVWEDTGLTWVPTSPHIPHASSTWAYACTGIAGELMQISNGVGYTLPFQLVGSPTLDGEALAATLRQHWTPGAGVEFRPARFKPFYATFAGQKCQGVQIQADPRRAPSLVEINYRLLEAMDAPTLIAAAAAERHSMFDKANGTDAVRKILAGGGNLGPLFVQWRRECEQFRQERRKWLIYPE
jgi:uncharacterized protein YbbC (DUF1343 family)